MSRKEKAAVIPKDPENTRIEAVHQLSARLTGEEQFLLQAIASEPRSISSAEWMSNFQGHLKEILCVEAFVEMRDKFLAARAVIEHPAKSGSYRATSLGRCVVVHAFRCEP